MKIAAIGPKTAQRLTHYGVLPDFVPQEYIAESILPDLGDLRGRCVLLPRAEAARRALPDAITRAEGIVHAITVYRTIPAKVEGEDLPKLKSGVDVVTFMSPSAVWGFVKYIRQTGLDPLGLPRQPKIFCIGPITRQAAEEAGFHSAIVAEEYTADGIVTALKKWMDKKHE